MHAARQRFHVARGLVGAGVGGAGAAAIAVALAVAFLACRWLITGANRIDRADDIAYAVGSLLLALPVCAVVGAGAGWATAAPPGRHRFATSLAIVFSASLAMWWTIALVAPRPTRVKSMAHDPLHLTDLLTEAMYLLVPPLVAAVLLTLIRLRGMVAGVEAQRKPQPDRCTRPPFSLF